MLKEFSDVEKQPKNLKKSLYKLQIDSSTLNQKIDD